MDNSVKQNYLIRIVDDDAGVLKGLSFLLACTGWKSVAYTTPLEFLEKDDLSVPGCILLDIRMPGMSGIELQVELNKKGATLPIVIVTGHADVETAVRTMKLGAIDFLVKPVEAEALQKVLEQAVDHSVVNNSGLSKEELKQVYQTLSPREQQILKLVGQGLTSKIIGERLGLSERTIQGHRLNLSKKFKIHSPQELKSCLNVLKSLQK